MCSTLRATSLAQPQAAAFGCVPLTFGAGPQVGKLTGGMTRRVLPCCWGRDSQPRVAAGTGASSSASRCWWGLSQEAGTGLSFSSQLR